MEFHVVTGMLLLVASVSLILQVIWALIEENHSEQQSYIYIFNIITNIYKIIKLQDSWSGQWNLILTTTKLTVWENTWHWFPCEIPAEEEVQKFHTNDVSLPSSHSMAKPVVVLQYVCRLDWKSDLHKFAMLQICKNRQVKN